MRVLAVRQPWASLIAEGHKTIEVRSRNTNIRETIAIYASRTIPQDNELAQHRHLIGDPGHDLPCGKIIAIADLVDSDICSGMSEFRLMGDKHHCSARYYQFGKTYLWCLENVRKINPIEFKATSITWSNVDDDLIQVIA